GPVEALRLDAVPDVTGLVGDPLLVHRIVDARQDAHHFAAAAIDANGGPDGVHHVDRFRLDQFPWARLERIGLAGERPDRAEVDNIARELARQRLLEIGGDLGILPAADQDLLRDSGHFGGETDAPGAMDAAVHRRRDDRAAIFVLDRAFGLGEAGRIHAIGHCLILQVALAALVADRAIER